MTVTGCGAGIDARRGAEKFTEVKVCQKL